MTQPYEPGRSRDPANGDIVVIEEADDERGRDIDANDDASDNRASDNDEATDVEDASDNDEASDVEDGSDEPRGDELSSHAPVPDEPAAISTQPDRLGAISDQPSLTLVSDEPSLTAGGYEPGHAAGDAEPSPAASREWQDIQALFVDDPRGAVELAAAAADSAVSALMTALREQQAGLTPAASGSADTALADPGQTEQLRAALRGYRALCQNLAQVGASLGTSTPV